MPPVIASEATSVAIIVVIASEATSVAISVFVLTRLLRRVAPRNDVMHDKRAMPESIAPCFLSKNR